MSKVSGCVFLNRALVPWCEKVICTPRHEGTVICSYAFSGITFIFLASQ